jgi:hypothetical protein
MDTSTKNILIVGGLVAVAGIGAAIYFAKKDKPKSTTLKRGRTRFVRPDREQTAAEKKLEARYTKECTELAKTVKLAEGTTPQEFIQRCVVSKMVGGASTIRIPF